MGTAIKPFLASDPMMAHESYEPNIAALPIQRPIVNVGGHGVNHLLGGGCGASRVYCITSQENLSNSHIVHELLASHLSSSQHTTSTIIDTTLAFDVQGLHRVIEQSWSSHTQNGSDNAAAEAMLTLQRLNIMRVFDHVGVKEAIDEVSSMLERTPVGDALRTDQSGVPSNEIEDSEGEEDMLGTPDQGGKHHAGLMSSNSANAQSQAAHLLIIHDVSQVMTLLLKNNYTQGQALVASLMRSLNHMTRAHHICTVLVTSATANLSDEQEQISQFQSCSMRSALGVGLGYLVDVHLYHHQIPGDPQWVNHASRASYPGVKAATAQVLEIVEDRFDGRLGRWTAITSGANNSMKDGL